jgi:uncharacterized protein YuzE
MIFDYNDEGKIVGIEILDASQRVDNPQAISYVIQLSKPS